MARKAETAPSRRDIIQVASIAACDAGRRATMMFDKDMKVADDYRGESVRMIADAVPGTSAPGRA